MWKSHILHTLSASKCFPCVGRSKPASFNFLFVLISDKQSAYKCPVFPGVNWEGLVYKQLGTWVTNTYTWPLETDSTWQLPKGVFPTGSFGCAMPCHATPCHTDWRFHYKFNCARDGLPQSHLSHICGNANLHKFWFSKDKDINCDEEFSECLWPCNFNTGTAKTKYFSQGHFTFLTTDMLYKKPKINS